MDNLNNKNVKEEQLQTDGAKQNTSEAKPVGYGSSIQNSGNGNRTRPANPDDSESANEEGQISENKGE